MNKLVESEAFIDSIRFKGTKVKINACSRFLQLSALPWHWEMVMLWIEWFAISKLPNQ